MMVFGFITHCLAGYIPLEKVLMIIGFIFLSTDGCGQTDLYIHTFILQLILFGTNMIYQIRAKVGLPMLLQKKNIGGDGSLNNTVFSAHGQIIKSNYYNSKD
jgi:hypothetical protein